VRRDARETPYEESAAAPRQKVFKAMTKRAGEMLASLTAASAFLLRAIQFGK
jgi:hypothetical protein